MDELMAIFGVMFAVIMVVGLVLNIALYVYTSFAFMSIGRKAGDEMAGLAWIPALGPLIIAFRASGMHWWPWLLLIGFVIPYLNAIIAIVFAVFGFIWMWKLFEKIGKPGWWPLLALIPVVGQIIFLVLIGIAAWGRD